VKNGFQLEVPSIKPEMALSRILGILISMTSQVNPGAILEMEFYGIYCGLLSKKVLNM
jgi:hypothetical protein